MKRKVPDNIGERDGKRDALIALNSEIVRRTNGRSEHSVVARHVWKVQKNKETDENEAREGFSAQSRNFAPEQKRGGSENRSSIDADCCLRQRPQTQGQSGSGQMEQAVWLS